jgi:hypothetical protein
LLAAVALGLGFTVYLRDRLPGSAHFLPEQWPLFAGRPFTFGSVGGWLPDFVHVYVSGLPTAVVLGTTRRTALAGCALWWLIDSLFELGQHPGLSPYLAVATPAWYDGIPFLENTGAYFAHGTFGYADLAAIALGALAAWVSVVSPQSLREGCRHEVSAFV